MIYIFRQSFRDKKEIILSYKYCLMDNIEYSENKDTFN